MGNTFPLNKCNKDILQSIFNNLSYQDLHKYQSVCKNWRRIMKIVIKNRYPLIYNWEDGIYFKMYIYEKNKKRWRIDTVFIHSEYTNKFGRNIFKNLYLKYKIEKEDSKLNEKFTKYYIQKNIELFNKIYPDESLKADMRVFTRVSNLMIVDKPDDYAMEMMDINGTCYAIRKKNNIWIDIPEEWKNDSVKEVISSYLNYYKGRKIFRDKFTHIFEYIVYRVRNYLDGNN